MTEEEIDAFVDKMMSWAEAEGERMGRELMGDDAWEHMYDDRPKPPEIGRLLRADLKESLMKRYGLTTKGAT